MQEQPVLLEEDGFEDEILVEEETTVVNAMWGDIGGNIENQADLQNALDAKQDSLTEAQLNAVNSGITSEKVTTYDGYADQIASKADQSALNTEATTREQADTALGRRIDDEATARQQADNGLQSQIDAITSQSDVVDVVANYAALQAYDTSSLSDNDVIKVLDDETHEDALTYYRWSTATQTWTYIGQEAPYYSKGQMDVMLQGKQDALTAGANIQIQNGTISATDTTYTAGNGLNLNGTEFSADTDVLATKEDLESYYTKPETDNLLAPKLEAEVVAELPATGEEGKLYLTPKAHTTQTATGNPITATVAEEAGALESFKLDGDTYQQTYTGKNLFDKSEVTIDGSRISTSTGTAYTNSTTVNYSVSPYITIEGGANYSITKTARTYVTWYNNGTYISGIGYTQGENLVAPENANQIRFDFLTAEENIVMLEKSSEPTTPYEPYCGGTPSPNPEYPQPIQTVTGMQTISINGTDYPLDLGSIELCKLDTYQDYIWKDGDDWKVHKAISSITLDGTEAWVYADNYNYARCPSYIFVDKPLGGTGLGLQLSNYFGVITDWGTFRDSTGRNAFFSLLDEGYKISIRNTGCSSVEAYISWFSTNKPSFYYPVETPTDTTITDTALIAQLEAIRTASLENGANTITNTAAGSNLAGDMGIGYYGYNPTNRYDKWLWLDLNNNYEQIGS